MSFPFESKLLEITWCIVAAWANAVPMKTRKTPIWFLGLALAVASSAAPAAQEKSSPLIVPMTADSHAVATPALAPGSTAEAPIPPYQSVASSPAVQSSSVDSKHYVSPWFTELLKLAKAGIQDTVMLAFINSAGTFNLDTDQIIQLHHLGISGELISAILQHDLELGASGTAVPEPPPPPSTLPNGAPSGLPQVASASAATESAPPSKTLLGPSSIVHMVSPDLPDIAVPSDGWEPPYPMAFEPAFSARCCRKSHRASDSTKTFPVREPYPVPLSDPIVMYRAYVPPANLMQIQTFP